MIRAFALILAGALWLTGCSAPDPFEDHDWPRASPALWHVTGVDGAQAWLFGTVHALPDGAHWQSDAVDQAFAASDVLLVEIADLGDGAKAASEFRRRAFVSGLPPLLDRVSAQDKPSIEALVERSGASLADLDGMKSWGAALMLSSAVRSSKPENGVDRALLTRGKPVRGLESFGSQYQLFDRLAEQDQIDLLLAVAQEAQAHDPVPALESWLTGDLAGLETLAQGGMLADPELRAALLDTRNREWADKVAEAMQSGEKPFVAVGAAHMLGPNGLPGLLQMQGLSVRRLQ